MKLLSNGDLLFAVALPVTLVLLGLFLVLTRLYYYWERQNRRGSKR